MNDLNSNKYSFLLLFGHLLVTLYLRFENCLFMPNIFSVVWLSRLPLQSSSEFLSSYFQTSTSVSKLPALKALCRFAHLTCQKMMPLRPTYIHPLSTSPLSSGFISLKSLPLKWEKSISEPFPHMPESVE